jgi:hypothetical protein
VLQKKFYTQQLQKVTLPSDTEFHPLEVLKSKGKGKSKQYLIHYLSEPKNIQHWISAALLDG